MLVVALQLALVAAPGAVRAHAILLDADPAPNSVVPTSPATLTLYFSEAVDPRSVTLRILDSEQQPIVGVGDPTLDTTGRVIRASLPELGPDTYTVEYTVVSAVDGHPTAQIYAFVVDPTGSAAPPALPIPTEPTTPPDPLGIAARWVATVAALLLAGTVVVWLLHRAWIGAEARAPVPWRVLAALAFVALIGLVTTVARAAAVAFAHGHAIPSGLPFDPLAPFGFTPYAIAMRLALAGAIAAMVIAATAGPWATRARLLAVGVRRRCDPGRAEPHRPCRRPRRSGGSRRGHAPPVRASPPGWARSRRSCSWAGMPVRASRPSPRTPGWPSSPRRWSS